MKLSPPKAILLSLGLLALAFYLPTLLQKNFSLSTSNAGFNDIVINARGTNGEEKIALYINDTPVQFWNLSKNFTNYTYTPPKAITVNTLSIHFLNDRWEPENGINYDVQIPYITVNGTTYNSEHDTTVSTGSWDQVSWCAPGNKKTQWLHCTGSFTYNIPGGTVVGIDPVEPVCENSQVEIGEQFDISQLEYAGAFRISIGQFGDSDIGWSSGIITVDSENGTLFVNGDHKYAVAEFAIPELSLATNMADLPLTGPPIQNFVDLLPGLETGNPEELNVITGMGVVNGSLLVNGIKTYDADGPNTHTSIVVADASNLSGAKAGFSKLTGAAHSAGWLSMVPPEYQESLGGNHIAGYSDVYAIDGRNSIGPSAFVLNAEDYIAAEGDDIIPATPVIDFNLENRITDMPWYRFGVEMIPLMEYGWTEVAEASLGIIMPGTSTYLAIGNSGGLNEGILYKNTQIDTGRGCSGPCTIYEWDNYNYLWHFDVNEMIESRDGLRAPYTVKPYDHGKWVVPFQDPDGDGLITRIRSASFDPNTNLLYLSLTAADKTQSIYEPAPLIVVYRFNKPDGNIVNGQCK